MHLYGLKLHIPCSSFVILSLVKARSHLASKCLSEAMLHEIPLLSMISFTPSFYAGDNVSVDRSCIDQMGSVHILAFNQVLALALSVCERTFRYNIYFAT